MKNIKNCPLCNLEYVSINTNENSPLKATIKSSWGDNILPGADFVLDGETKENGIPLMIRRALPFNYCPLCGRKYPG